MQLYYDLRLGYIVETPGLETAVGAFSVKSGDYESIVIQFGRSEAADNSNSLYAAGTWTPENLAGGTVIKLGIKEDGQYADGTILCINANWTNDDLAYTYSGELNLNTTEINTALGRLDANSSNDVSSLACQLELTFQVGGSGGWRSSVLGVDVTILHDIIGGTEGTPTSAADPSQYILTADAASVATGYGASLIGIEDAALNFTGTTVEAALAELSAADADKTGLDATVVSGTAGTANNLAKWNADGDLIDSDVVEARVINSMGTGIVEGGIISINGGDNAKFDVSAGHGVVIDETDPDAPIVYNVSWTAFSAQTVTNLATDTVTYVSINSAGSLVQSTSPPVASDGQLSIFIGQLGHANNTSIGAAVVTPNIFNNGTNLIRAISETLGVLGTGNEVTANGANLSINKAVGTLVKEGINYEAATTARHTKVMAAQTLATFRRRTQTGLGATATTIDPANYDLAGVITAVPANKYTNQRVYLISSGNIVIQYGQTLHSNMLDAVQGINGENFTVLANLQENAKLIGVISVKYNATDLSNTSQAQFSKVDSISSPAGVGVSDHGGLVGLGDNDHPQYLLAADAASTSNSFGASLIGIEDSALNFAGTTVESALAELAAGASGTVTSVAVTGTDGIDVDSGSPITTAGTITLGVNASTLKTHLSLENVENTALSTWAGSTNVTTLGTISTGTVPAANVSGLATVATTGAYANLSGLPTLGTAARKG
jgi:hypothetical protein